MAEEQKNCKPSDCAGCAHADSCSSKPQDFKKPANPHSHVNKVIAVVSGKGGVGKSMVTASLARMMKEQGFSVGILDADITGPSIPKMYGVHEAAVEMKMESFHRKQKTEQRSCLSICCCRMSQIRLFGEDRSLPMQ